jgi:hypothetical protein
MTAKSEPAAPPTLAEARIARRGRHRRLARAAVVAAAIAIVGGAAARSQIALVIVGAVAVVAGVLRLARHHVRARDALPPPAVPDGIREYAYRPRAPAYGVVGGSVAIGVVAILVPGLLRFPVFALIALLAIVLGGVAAASIAAACVLRRRIIVGDAYVTVPRSWWSRGEVTLPLADVALTIDGTADAPVLSIAVPRRQPCDVAMAFLGHDQFDELVAVLEHRSGSCAARRGPG